MIDDQKTLLGRGIEKENMADKKYKRILHLLLFLRRKGERGATGEEIKKYLEEKLDDFSYSERTFARDKEELTSIWNTELIYNKKTNTYTLDNSFFDEQLNRIVQEQWILEALRENPLDSEMILFEKRSPRSLEFFYDILYGIANQKCLSFDYFKYDTETTTHRKLMPYALKEFNYQWYLIGSETNDPACLQMKHFALDRISHLEVCKGNFKQHTFDVNAYFEHCFGIVRSDKPPAEIVLRFDRQQGNYVKSLAWHHSQEVVSEDNTYLVVKFVLAPAYDFEHKILSLGNRVEVLSPVWFREQIAQSLERTLLFYKKE